MAVTRNARTRDSDGARHQSGLRAPRARLERAVSCTRAYATTRGSQRASLRTHELQETRNVFRLARLAFLRRVVRWMAQRRPFRPCPARSRRSWQTRRKRTTGRNGAHVARSRRLASPPLAWCGRRPRAHRICPHAAACIRAYPSRLVVPWRSISHLIDAGHRNLLSIGIEFCDEIFHGTCRARRWVANSRHLVAAA